MSEPLSYIEPWWLTVRSVKDNDCRRFLSDAVVDYCNSGIVTDFAASPDPTGSLEALFLTIKAQIDRKAEKRKIARENGAKGGAPKGNKNAAKARPEVQRNEHEPQRQPEARTDEQPRQEAQAQPEQPANQPVEKPQPSTKAEERPRQTADKKQKQPYSDRIESVETLFERNFKAPEYEFDRLKGWVKEKYSGSGWDGLKPSEKRKTLSNWRPETQGERFPRYFLDAWGALITAAKNAGVPEMLVSDMLSDKIRFSIENDEWVIYMSEGLRKWLLNREAGGRFTGSLTGGGKRRVKVVTY